MLNTFKTLNFVEIIFTMAVITGGFFLFKHKIDLTVNAKEDVILIKNLREQILNKELDLKNPLIVKNSFDGNIKIMHNKKSVQIESDNLPYQSCFRYALDGEVFDSIYVNNELLYLNGQMVARDKALKLCLLNENNSVVQYNIKI